MSTKTFVDEEIFYDINRQCYIKGKMTTHRVFMQGNVTVIICLERIGGAERDRTADLLVAKTLLDDFSIT